MLLTIRFNDADAMDLSWLLHKNPDRLQSFDLGYGRAYVFFPEYDPASCTACLLLEMQEDGLNRVCRAKDGEFQYVNPRQYLSSSLLGAAMARVYSSALRGVCVEYPALVEKEHDIEVEITAFSCRVPVVFMEKLFGPLGYRIHWTAADEAAGASESGYSCGTLRLAARGALRDVLSHLYIFIPVFDRWTHLWLDESLLEKFIRCGRGWLGGHPEKRFIIQEYFGAAGELKKKAMERFGALCPQEGRQPKLNACRQAAISEALARSGAKTVIDLGCGDGTLISFLLEQDRYARLAGMDVCAKNVALARKRIAARAGRGVLPADIFTGSLTCRDKRMDGYDAAVLSEVIEHFEPDRMEIVMENILGKSRPRLLVVTTPNQAYNGEFPFLEPGGLRHPDHRHEFDEAGFAEFCRRHAVRFGYEVGHSFIGENLPRIGAPVLMGVFTRCA